MQIKLSNWADGSFGFFAGVSNADYQAAAGVNASHLKRLAVSPAESQLPFEVSPQAQRAIDIGTLAHGFALENSTPEKMGFAVRPAGMKLATKAGIEWREINPGPMVDAEQIATAEEIFKAISADANTPQFDEMDTELSARAIRPDGMVMKARFDAIDIAAGIAYDIKTTSRGADPASFGRECLNRGYLLQAAHYIRVAALLGVELREFVFIAASSVAPYEVGNHSFGPSHVAWPKVNAKLDKLYALDAECRASGKWPKREWDVAPVQLPHWYLADELDMTGVENETVN